MNCAADQPYSSRIYLSTSSTFSLVLKRGPRGRVVSFGCVERMEKTGARDALREVREAEEEEREGFDIIRYMSLFSVKIGID